MTGADDKVDPHLLTRTIWHGKSADALGLKGEILRSDFEALFKGHRNLKR